MQKTQSLQVQCYRNLNLLAHAQLEELDIGSRCGGHGICGGDKIKLDEESRSSVSPLTDTEKQHLTKEEIASGWRLACQCWPNDDHLNLTLSTLDATGTQA